MKSLSILALLGGTTLSVQAQVQTGFQSGAAAIAELAKRYEICVVQTVDETLPKRKLFCDGFRSAVLYCRYKQCGFGGTVAWVLDPQAAADLNLAYSNSGGFTSLTTEQLEALRAITDWTGGPGAVAPFQAIIVPNPNLFLQEPVQPFEFNFNGSSASQ